MTKTDATAVEITQADIDAFCVIFDFKREMVDADGDDRRTLEILARHRQSSIPAVTEVGAVARAIHDALYKDERTSAWMSGTCPLASVTIDGEVDLINAARAAIAAMGRGEKERILAWLREQSSTGAFFADAIARGDHMKGDRHDTA